MQHFADEPDDTRPSNPWPRLILLGVVILFVFVAFGACFVAFLGTGAEPELRVPFDQIETNVPRFEPVTRWGADPERYTYGVWIVQPDTRPVRALFNRNVASHCTVEWLPTEQFAGVTGIFRDRCNGEVFAIDGTPLSDGALRHLDHFDLNTRDGEVVIDVRSVSIGDCVQDAAAEVICATGGPITRTVPLTGSIPVDFATK